MSMGKSATIMDDESRSVLAQALHEKVTMHNQNS